MSSRADLLIVAQQTMHTHHRTATGGCAECKTSHPHPCPTWTLARQVVSLVLANISTYPTIRGLSTIHQERTRTP